MNITTSEPLPTFKEWTILQSPNAGETSRRRAVAAPKPTALRVAVLRAAHQVLDTPLVFEDPLALRILGTTEEELLLGASSRLNTPLLKGLRTSIVVRSRLAEDEWARSKQNGVEQYVILGAGLDTFACRSRNGDTSRIFEVDLPETQQWKLDCLNAAGMEKPASLTFVPVDFERSTLAEALEKAEFRREEPAFFSWLGVTMYLEEEAITSTLHFIASLMPGSGIVFDYSVLPALLSIRERKALEAIAAHAAEGGEPWKTSFVPASLAEMLHALGFREVDDLGPKQLNERYLSGRTDGLRKSGASRLICARL